MFDPIQAFQSPEDLEVAVQAAKLLLSPEQAEILETALTETKECLDKEDYDGAIAVAARFGFEDTARIYIDTLLTAKAEQETVNAAANQN